ncbi:prion formation protein 1 [Penicillium manginii]|uniref:prion formation protein 1 n=1 Tax=Penicillium manginii TaxID=203109 RepID=UPI002549A281|nr:prion formation protein 1 [Penicillium manginii]KAJ5734547.1 prion formation protein 1 [Penicillium manginii]
MPHTVSPSETPAMPTVVAKSPSGSSQVSLDGAYAVANLLIQSVGTAGLLNYNVVAEARKAAADKKNGAKRESAMLIIGALFERFPREFPLSEAVFLLQDQALLNVVLDSLADKGAVVRDAAQYAVDALYACLSPEAKVNALVPALENYLSKGSGKWQGFVGGYSLLEKMAVGAQMGTGSLEEEREKDVLREALGKTLKELIPIVENGMHDLKSEVAKQSSKSMNALTTLLSNDDVAPRIPLLIQTMEQPSAKTLQKAIHALSQTTFVAIVTSPVLALLTPLLERSLNDPTTPQETLRQTVVVVENLTKLVHDPAEARTFLPKLQPGVKNVVNRASLPEVRELATRALDVMDKAMADKDVASGSITKTTPEEVLAVLNPKIQEHGGFIGFGDAKFHDLTKNFVAGMVREAVNARTLDRIPSNITPYLRGLLAEDSIEAISTAVQAHFTEEDERKFGKPVQADPNEIVIVNANFSLAYGGMLLLSHTNLRLVKGHRYVSPTTSWRVSLPPEEVRTCFVEHNQGEDADLSILEYVAKDPAVAGEGKEHISSVLTEFGFTDGPEGRQSQPVGSLSGGWKMKLALARAMLLKADVLLLDEPTNHLDVANVKWLQEYLKRHTDITSLIVSHDSGFLDEVCTDIYHYEQKKLVNYPGNLADFVKVNPEGKSYYTLSASTVQFKFPPSCNCSYTYPGAPKPSLQDASLSLTLSSRVAIIGGNGAGKSTFIKMLTGETIPQGGKVEKHPNLRIGYIKQHALEHVEMHLEKTPSQYIMWRYANGDDREVFLKQTRILTEEDKKQLETPIDLGDGRGPRRIDTLIGRQKYKKTFQYEVKWVGLLPKYNTMISRETLIARGFTKMVQEFDDHEASREGLGYRILDPKTISKHFEDVGLDPEIANHNEISGLSGGQKVKVVLAGAMWNNPHLLVLDEPTNFLDRDSLGGLAVAIRDFKGGVVMISHNEEFVGALCPEQLHIADGRVVSRTNTAISLDRFEDSAANSPSAPGTPAGVSAAASAATSAAASAVNSGAEDTGDLKFRAKKKKKMTRAQQKDREVRRRLRHIEWLNSPKGTPKPVDTDDEE